MSVYIYSIYIYTLPLEGHLSNHPQNAPKKGRPLSGCFRNEILGKTQPGISWGKSSSSKPGRSPVGSIFWVVALAFKKSSHQHLWEKQPFFRKCKKKKRDKFCNLGWFWGQYFFVSWVRSFSTHFFLERKIWDQWQTLHQGCKLTNPPELPSLKRS